VLIGDPPAGSAPKAIDGVAGDTLPGGAGLGHDVLQFSKSTFADWAHLLGATRQQGSDLAITPDSGDVNTLRNAALAGLSHSDARFV
jgi:hypothetical protein